MADKKQGSSLIPHQGGVLRNVVNQLKLILRLLGDSRVSLFLKVIPIGALAYLISPVDLAPGVVFPVIGALDDAAVIWLGSALFLELCPPNVVKEHMQELTNNLEDDSTDDVIDAESTDVK